MYEEFFAKRLTQLRTQKGVSAREMSLAIGQNESYINRIENRVAFPSMQGFFYICEYLDVTPGEFFESEIPLPYELRKAMDGLKKLDHKQVSAVLAMIEVLLEKVEKYDSWHFIADSNR